MPPRQAGPAQAPPAAAPEPRFTRAAAAWFATAAALLLLILLIIFILQNQARVAVRFFGLEGILPLGTAMLIAAVTGGMVVVIIGVVRMVQLRRSARRVRGRQ